MTKSPEAGPSPAETIIVPVEAQPSVVRPTEQINDQFTREVTELTSTERARANQERADAQALERAGALEAALEVGPRNPQEIVEIINAYSFQDLQKREQERKHGQGFIGNVRSWWRGDKDFIFNEKGELEENAKAQLSRRALSSVLNRRTIASVAAVGALGALTGGVGWVSGLIPVLGSIGRLSGEMIDHFKGTDPIRGGTRGARREVMLAEKERYYEMQQLSADLARARGEGKATEAYQILDRINALYHRQGEAGVMGKVARAEKNFKEKEAKLEKLRGRLQTVGEVTGLGTGLAASFLTGQFGALNLDWFQNNGQSMFHEVVRQNNSYHFLWSQADKAAGLGSGAASHVLTTKAAEAAGATTNILIASIIERGLPVIGASLLASLTNRVSQRGEEKAGSEEMARRTEDYRAAAEHIPNMRGYLEGVARENHIPHLPGNPDKYKYDWATQPQTLEKSFQLDQLPLWRQVEVREGITGSLTDREGRIIKVGVAGVDVDKNQIAIVESIDNLSRANATVFPVRLLRLDDFLRRYQPIVRDIEGQTLRPAGSGSTPGAEGSPGGSSEGDYLSTFNDEKSHDERNQQRLDSGKSTIEKVKRGELLSDEDFIRDQIDRDATSPDVAQRAVRQPDVALFKKIADEFFEDWDELKPSERENAGVTFKGEPGRQNPNDYFDYINISSDDGSEKTIRLIRQEKGPARLAIGERSSDGKQSFRSARLGEAVDFLRDLRVRLDSVEGADHSEEVDSSLGENSKGAERSHRERGKSKLEAESQKNRPLPKPLAFRGEGLEASSDEPTLSASTETVLKSQSEHDAASQPTQTYSLGEAKGADALEALRKRLDATEESS